tara:strand:+ start:211 stop:366 length:156 start_codon:yes stop_codon:yes gene_type:complete
MFKVIWKERGQYKTESFYCEEKAKKLGQMISDSGFGVALIQKTIMPKETNT